MTSGWVKRNNMLKRMTKRCVKCVEDSLIISQQTTVIFNKMSKTVSLNIMWIMCKVHWNKFAIYIEVSEYILFSSFLLFTFECIRCSTCYRSANFRNPHTLNTLPQKWQKRRFTTKSYYTATLWVVWKHFFSSLRCFIWAIFHSTEKEKFCVVQWFPCNPKCGIRVQRRRKKKTHTIQWGMKRS